MTSLDLWLFPGHTKRTCMDFALPHSMGVMGMVLRREVLLLQMARNRYLSLLCKMQWISN
jgi:hypothetical protein